MVQTFSSNTDCMLSSLRTLAEAWQKLVPMQPFWVDVVLVYIMGKQSLYFYLVAPRIALSSDFMYAVPHHLYLLEQRNTDVAAQKFLSVASVHTAIRVDTDNIYVFALIM